MRFESLEESRDTELRLTAAEAMHLDALGKRLTSKTTWWGQTDAEEKDTIERSVIRVRSTPAGSWMVRVSDAVGVIAIPGLQVTVKPKIPLGHLLHMFGRVDVLPRLDERPTEIEQTKDLLELTARWFLSAAKQLLQLGLIRDYEPERRELPAVRGRLEL
jgi:McrBC 5-methylcytosine restriction system component